MELGAEDGVGVGVGSLVLVVLLLVVLVLVKLWGGVGWGVSGLLVEGKEDGCVVGRGKREG